MTIQSINVNTDAPADPKVADDHAAKMAAAFDAQAGVPPSSEPSAPTVPDFIPEKFRKAADPIRALAEAYDAAVKKIGQPPEPKTEAPKEEAKKEGTDNPLAIEQAAAEETLAKAGLNFDDFAAEFAQSGGLTDASYEKLEQAGIPRDYVDAFIDGQAARAEAIRYQVLAEVGGEQGFADMSKWASKNLTKAELDAYNAAVDNPDVNVKRLAVQGLYSRYTASAGTEPALVGGTVSSGRGDVFRSVNEVTTAMSDPRYGSDPAYTQDVIAKLGRSEVL